MTIRYPEKTCLFMFLNLFLGAVLFAQTEMPQSELPEGPKFYFDALSFASDQAGLSRVDLYTEVPSENLHFTKEGGLFLAAYEVTVGIYDSAETLVNEKWWDEKIETRDYEATVTPSASRLSQKSFLLAPGKYAITVQIKDKETNKSTRIKRKIEVKNYSGVPFSISDIMLISHLDSSAEQKVVYPNITGNVGSLREGFHIFFEAYNPLMAESARVWVTIKDLSGEKVQSDSFLQPLISPRRSCFHREETSKLIAGDYILEVRAVPASTGADPRLQGVSAVTERPLAIHWRGLPVTIVDLDRAIDQMQYVADREQLDEMKKAPQDKKKDLFNEFWKKKDPTPGTERNELMEEYFSRVAYANKHFGHYIEGWKTDMGMVYIIFGAPNNIDRHPFEIDSKPYEIWTYYTVNREFVFVDATGFGDYRLQSPIWDLYNTRPR